MTPRQYQLDAVQSIYDYFENSKGNPCVVMPTASGKAFVIALFLQRALSDFPETRALVLTHVRELIQQDYNELKRLWPEARTGIFSAGLSRRELGKPITFCGIQSAHKRAHEMGRVDLVLVDEAHLLGRDDSSMYRRFIDDLTRYNPRLKTIGFTATPFRLDSGLLTEGENRLFTDVCYEARLLDLSEQGYLAQVVSKATQTVLDVRGVGTRGGDFIQSELERAVDKADITRAAVAEIVALGADRRSWLAFCSGVHHAEHVRDAIRDHGIACEMVAGSTPTGERDRILQAFKSGELRAVTNCNVLTTGFNHPGLDLIALLRPTKSVSLFVQMLGRGTRTAPGKDNCKVLDFSGNIRRHGPLDQVNGRRRERGTGPAPMKVCPNCASIVPAGVRECADCGFVWPPPEVKIEPVAAALPVLSNQAPPTAWVPVDRVTYRRHDKADRPPSLRVDYGCGLVRFSEWICPEHGGYARQKAAQWWAQRGGPQPLPTTVEGAIRFADRLTKPTAIQVRSAGRFAEVVGARFQ